jgi:KaiC/GvpD/RAD55 family RecA-like ATPase
MAKDKFEFDSGFQWEIIKHILLDSKGYKVLMLVSYEYFDLDQQKIIVRAIQKFFAKRKKLPSTSAILNEEVRSLFHTRDYAKAFTELDRKKILKRVRLLFKSLPKDPEEIYEKCKSFAAFVKLKKVMEEVDITDNSQYQNLVNKIQGAVNIGMELDEKRGSMMVTAARIRLFNRHNRSEVYPTPYPALNRLSNSNGYQLGSVFVILDKPKKGKTLALVNLAIAYAKSKAYEINRVIYFDLENGEDAITARIDQSLLGVSKHEILSGAFDDKLAKSYRVLKRFKSEIYVIRMPNGCTTNDLQIVVDEFKRDYGITFTTAIIDYIGIMGCLSGKTEDTPRISDAFLDVKNWARRNNIVHTWTGHHVVRNAYARRLTKYKPEDTAKCIDIERHVDGMFGLQQSEEDIKVGLVRLEVIEQRDGMPFGRVVFKQELKTQRLIPLSKEDQQEYNLAFGGLYSEGVETDDLAEKKSKSKPFKL